MDQISDILIRIKNAQKAGRIDLEAPFSNFKLALAKILEKEKFIAGVEEKGKKAAKKIKIILKYNNGRPAIHDLKRISRPSRRLYLKKDEIYPVKQGAGIAIISTPKGLMTDKEARKAKVGGEIICEIW